MNKNKVYILTIIPMDCLTPGRNDSIQTFFLDLKGRVLNDNVIIKALNDRNINIENYSWNVFEVK